MHRTVTRTHDGFTVTLTGERRDNGPWPIVKVIYVATGVSEWVAEDSLQTKEEL